MNALVAVGFTITGWGCYCVIRAKHAAEWPSVEGKVNSCELLDTSDVDGPSYRVEVNYSYEVSGRRYHGNRIGFGYARSNNHARHAFLHARLSEAETVEVYYDPSYPWQSVLREGIERPPWHFV